MEDTQIIASQVPPNQSNPNKFHSHFMYKAIIVAIFLVFLPLFPSQAPDFINRTFHTRSWEFVQLLFVGIAVSYGLFSRKNDETDNNYNSKFDNVNSYMSRFLQVSSVFDDEPEVPTGSDQHKVQTWNSQYFRGEPMVVVAQESEEQRGTTSRVGEKPLLLPVRSLKSRVSDFDATAETDDSGFRASSLRRSSSIPGSRRFSDNSSKSRNGEIGGSFRLNFEEKADENVVLRSPIPWRSRTGRTEITDRAMESDGAQLNSLPPPMEENEFHRIRPQFSRSSKPSSLSSLPNKLSPSPPVSSPKKLSLSPSSSSESQAKNVEDMARKKIYYKPPSSVPPPPPPPPPPQHGLKPPRVKELNRSVSSYMSENDKRSVSRVLSDGSLAGKSVRTIRAVEPSRTPLPKTVFGGYEREGKQNQPFVDNNVGGSDEDSDLEEDVIEGGSRNKDGAGSGDGDVGPGSRSEEVAGNGEGDVGPDVDKKADEFIAKFREQIRLQRIDSIKRSTGQIARNSTR